MRGEARKTRAGMNRGGTLPTGSQQVDFLPLLPPFLVFIPLSFFRDFLPFLLPSLPQPLPPVLSPSSPVLSLSLCPLNFSFFIDSGKNQ